MDFIAAGFDPSRFGSLTLRQVQVWMRGAAQRNAHDMARMARSVWVGSQLNSDGLDRFIALALGDDIQVPPEQAVFALQASTAGLPKIKRNVRARTA